MNDTNEVEQSTTAPESVETPLAEQSLAEYRAQRDKAAAPKASDTAQKSTAGVTAGENDAEEDAADDTQEQGEKPAAEKKKGGFQRKIEKLTEDNRKLSEQLAARVAAQPESKPKDKPAEVVEIPKAPAFVAPKPRLEDFDSLETFTDALTDWKADERDFKRDQAKAAATAQAEQKKILDGWNSRQAESRKAHSDYDEVLESVNDIALTPEHQRIFLESDHGAEIAYQIASDPAELKKFAAMQPLAAARYFGKLEAAFSEEDSPETETKVSKAPKPIRPVGARASTSGTPDLAKLSLTDYRRLREAGKLR